MPLHRARRPLACTGPSRAFTLALLVFQFAFARSFSCWLQILPPFRRPPAPSAGMGAWPFSGINSTIPTHSYLCWHGSAVFWGHQFYCSSPHFLFVSVGPVQLLLPAPSCPLAEAYDCSSPMLCALIVDPTSLPPVLLHVSWGSQPDCPSK